MEHAKDIGEGSGMSKCFISDGLITGREEGGGGGSDTMIYSVKLRGVLSCSFSTNVFP